MTGADLATARLLWQMGDWSALAGLPAALHERGQAAP